MKIIKKSLMRLIIYFCLSTLFAVTALFTDGVLHDVCNVLTYVFLALIAITMFAFIPFSKIKSGFNNLIGFIGDFYRDVKNAFLEYYSKRRIARIKDVTNERKIIFNPDNINRFNIMKMFSKRARWKDMKTNAERVRFIYARFIERKLKQGLDFKSAQTPNEIYENFKNESDPPENLFSLYNVARYGKDAQIGDESIADCLNFLKR